MARRKSCEGCPKYQYSAETLEEPEMHDCDLEWECIVMRCAHFSSESGECDIDEWLCPNPYHFNCQFYKEPEDVQ